MANTYKNIIISPNRDTSANVVPTIRFSGGDGTSNTDINVRVYTAQNGTLSVEGTAGQLFSITNDLSNIIFSVNDISGIPSLEIDANGKIVFAQYGGNVGIGTANTPERLSVDGNIKVSSIGSAYVIIEADTDNIDEAHNAKLLLRQDGGFTTARMGFRDNSNDIEILNESIADLRLGSNNTYKLTIDYTGNVGIGTTSPTANLHLTSASPTQFKMTSTGSSDSQRIIFGNPIDTGFGEVYPGGASLYHLSNTFTISSYSSTTAKVSSFSFYNPDGTIHYATIDSTGLGVGFFKTSPAYTLDVGGTTSTETLLVNGIDMDVKTTAAFDKANTVNVRSTTPLNIYVGTTAPTGNSVGDIWIDTN